MIRHHTLFAKAIAATDSAVSSFDGFNTLLALREMYRRYLGKLK